MNAVTVTHDFKVMVNGIESFASLTYDSSDPWAVTMKVTEQPSGTDVVWTFARSLLDGEPGLGAVKVGINYGTLNVSLSSSNGKATVAFPVGPVNTFLAMTKSMVRPGTEPMHVDWKKEFEFLDSV